MTDVLDNLTARDLALLNEIRVLGRKIISIASMRDYSDLRISFEGGGPVIWMGQMAQGTSGDKPGYMVCWPLGPELILMDHLAPEEVKLGELVITGLPHVMIKLAYPAIAAFEARGLGCTPFHKPRMAS